MPGDPNNLIAEKDLRDYEIWQEEQAEIENWRQAILDTQQRIKCACVFWEPWECSKIRHMPDENYEACRCICHNPEVIKKGG